jgi:hypothetical protein
MSYTKGRTWTEGLIFSYCHYNLIYHITQLVDTDVVSIIVANVFW